MKVIVTNPSFLVKGKMPKENQELDLPKSAALNLAHRGKVQLVETRKPGVVSTDGKDPSEMSEAELEAELAAED